MVCLSHHAGFWDGKLLLTVVAKKWGVELWLARSRRENGEVAVTEVGREEARLLLLLRLRREASGAGWTEGGRLGLDLTGEVLGQVERRSGGGVREAWLREGLRGRLLIAQEAAGIRVVGREVGLRHGKLLESWVDEVDAETDG
jgi:hypothetical protein